MSTQETDFGMKHENNEENAVTVSVSAVKKTNSVRDEFNRKTEDLFDYLQGLQKIKSASDVDVIVNKINEVLEYLPGPSNVQKILKIDSCAEFINEFAKRRYSTILSRLIDKFDSNFPLIDGMVHDTVNRLFVIEDAEFFVVSFSTLLTHLKGSSSRDALLALITNLLESEGIFVTICSYIIEKEDASDVAIIDYYSKYELFVQSLVSLPNTVANVMEGNISHMYKPDNYCCFLVFNVIKIIEFFSDLMWREKDVSFNFKSLSLFLSKTIVIFHSSKGLVKLVKIMELLTNNTNTKSAVYKKIFATVLKELQRFSIETFTVMILQNLTSNKNVANVLSENLIENKDWQFVLCKKIPLLSYYDANDYKLINNLITYLKISSVQHLFDLFLNLLAVWSDKFSFTRISLEQHLYVTKLVILAAKHLNTFNFSDSQRNSVQKNIYMGIPAHLECGIDSMRVIGMVTGEIVSELVTRPPNGSEEIKLQFEYDKLSKECQDLARDLKSLTEKTEETFDGEAGEVLDIILQIKAAYGTQENNIYTPPARNFRNKNKVVNADNEVVVETASNFKNNTITIIDSTDFELDSDDDLEPYDTSNDVKVSKKPAPAYLRDLRDGLLETQDAELFVLSVENCEKLITQQLNNDDASVGLEILEILLTLTPTFYVENFDHLVFQSCIAITCTYPAFYAEYLCKQFHADTGTYSICHRILMLDVLRESAKTLSALKPETNVPEATKKKRSTEAETAAEIIKKRLETKTRRFIKHKSHRFENLNKFADVAGWFFFPLIYGYGKSKFLSADDDNVLLIHFLQTLSIVICAAQNCAVAPKMARELFNLSWFLRFHREVKVRMAVLSMIAAGILNVPKSILLSEFTDVLLEMRFWLIDMINPHIEREPNSECRILGTHVMCILEDVLKVNTGLES